MLATPWPAPFADDEWLFELKWDGVRGLLSVDDEGPRLHSRAGNDMTDRYPELVRGPLPQQLVLDGEIVALDDRGHPSFELLQGRMNLAQLNLVDSLVPVSFVVFDLLHERESLIDCPLEERLARLAEIALPPGLVVPDRFASDATPLWDFATEHNLEGIVAKRRGSRYQPGLRSPDWRKVGRFQQIRAVVGGYTPGSGGRRASFGALLLGLQIEGGLRWIGSVGTGFDEKALRAIRNALDQMVVASTSFIPDPEIPEATWVSPQLVAVVRFKQWTKAGRLRAPSFKGFSDLGPESATWETEGPK
jgi:bifunctional non-homologous end joining protein LigD